jgi:DNA-binding response OmpR family regulator
MRILLVEDDPSLRDVIARELGKKGYGTDACADGLSAEDFLAAAEYDCVILDRMLPGKEGTEVVRDMRASGNATPVLLLTARDSVQDRVEGLDAGADDYLVKPFAFDELFARVRALTRRTAEQKSAVLKEADLELDTAAQTVKRAGKEISLSAKEYALLEYLLRNAGTVLSREQIIGHVWNFDFEGDSNIVDVYIRYLRRKMDDGFDPPLIHTLRGRGYMLNTPPAADGGTSPKGEAGNPHPQNQP